jgi:hypothetical protein
MKVGRNELCPCGSGKKYKKCCGLVTTSTAADGAAESWWAYPEFGEKVRREFASYFEAVLVPTGELCHDIVESANREMNALGDSVTWLHFVMFHLSLFVLQAHLEAVVLVGQGLSGGAVKVLRGMFEALVVAKYLAQNPAEVEDYRDYYKVILWKRYQYLAKVEPEKAMKLPAKRVSEISTEYEVVKNRFPKKHQWHQKKGVKDMAEEVSLGDMYDWFYCSASSLHHANMEGLHTNFLKWEKRGDRVEAIGPSLSGCGSALAVADLMILKCLDTLDTSFSLGFAQRIAELRKKSDAGWAARAAGNTQSAGTF